MKFTLLLLILSLFLTSNAFSSSNSITIVCGKISNSDKYPDLFRIQIIERTPVNYLHGDIYYADIKEDGSFRFEFEKIFPSDVMFIYKYPISLYIKPGDSINVEFDADDIVRNFNKPANQHPELSSLKFNGDNAEMNNAISLFLSYLNFGAIGDNTSNEEIMLPEEYLQYANKIYNRQNYLLDSLLHANNYSKEFGMWAHNEIYYRFADRLLHYMWNNLFSIKHKQKVLEVPDSYLKAIEQIQINNEEALNNSEYYSFLYEHFISCTYHKTEYGNSRNLVNMENFREYFLNYIHEIEEKYQGISFEINLSNELYALLAYYKRIDVFDELYLKYKDSIRPLFQKLLNEKYLEVKKELEEPDYNRSVYKQGTKEIVYGDSVFSSIINENKGKLIYIDFWATWCGPCLMEMKNSKELVDQYKGKDIEFVYVCVKSDKAKWEEKVRENNLSGTNCLINDTEYAKLSAEFNISGIPHYVLIGKNGNIIDKNAPRPSSGVTITNLLNQNL